jgi:hypothetical protein
VQSPTAPAAFPSADSASEATPSAVAPTSASVEGADVAWEEDGGGGGRGLSRFAGGVAEPSEELPLGGTLMRMRRRRVAVQAE